MTDKNKVPEFNFRNELEKLNSRLVMVSADSNFWTYDWEVVYIDYDETIYPILTFSYDRSNYIYYKFVEVEDFVNNKLYFEIMKLFSEYMLYNLNN